MDLATNRFFVVLDGQKGRLCYWCLMMAASCVKKNIPSVRHFKNCGVQNLKLTVIERVRKQDQDIRKAREKYWILRL